jgi:hypothetical protein
MSTLTIRLPDTKHQRLKAFARTRGVSLNKLVEEWATVALAQVDAENRYRLRASRGRPEAGLALLDKLERSLGRRAKRKKASAEGGEQPTRR